ncbi:MAG TPA: IS66 family transposase [Tepidisphaeraceae bacterium]|nr:IS66 family transposase [Tepidisphaeraceae bacterium]
MDDADLQLPDDPQALKRIIARQRADHATALAERDRSLEALRQDLTLLREDNALLEHRLRMLLRASYGPRAERFDPRQLLLFGLRVPPIQPVAPSGVALTQPAAPVGVPAPAERKPHGRRKLPDHLPRIRIEHDLEESERACTCCGEQRRRIAEQITEQLEHVPANFVVLQHARIKYACKHCNSGSCAKCDGQAHIAIADKPHQPIEGGLAGPGLLAYVATSKLADHLPLYRIQQIFARQKVEVSRSTLCGWMKATADLVRPLYDLICQRVRLSDVIHTDDTTVPVMDEGHCRTGRLWTYVGDLLHPYIAYDYTPTRARQGPLAWLGQWKGYLQADAYAGYDAVYAKGVIEVACWAHCRRYFFDAQESDSIRSAQMLGMIQQLYAVEKATEAMTAAQRAALRRSRAQPVLDQIKLWLDAQHPQVLPRSPIGQAITYAANQWPALCLYVTDGRLSIDNNAAERALRRVAVGRKNWLFSGTDDSAMGHAVLWSLIASAQRHELDVQLYLRSVLAWLPATPLSHLDRFLPDVWKRELMAEHAAQLQAQNARILSASNTTTNG